MNRLIALVSLVFALGGTQAFASGECPIDTRQSKVIGPAVDKSITKALNAVNESRVADAIEIMQQIETKHQHEQAQIALNLALMYLRLDREVEAREQLAQAVKLDSLSGKRHAFALKQYAALLAKDDQHLKAITQYKKWIGFTCKDNSVSIISKIAQSYARMNKWKTALSYAQKGLDVDPLNTELLRLEFNAERFIKAAPSKMNELDKDEDDIAVLIRIAPKYPSAASRKGINGWVIMSYNVNTVGRVENINVIKQDPSGLFKDSAVEALKKWLYKPKFVYGEAVVTEGLTIQLDFNIQQSPDTEDRTPPGEIMIDF